ncbi:MAG: hybrid sensor histidine kinase/response regulator [Pseudomonadota bacterium]
MGVAGLHITSADGVFIFVLLISIAIGNALRFGRTYLWISAGTASLGIASLFFLSTFWNNEDKTIFAFTFGIPFLAFYIDHLVTALRDAKNQSEARNVRLEKLVSFVSHEIRTPLQALLASTQLTLASCRDAETRAKLARIKDSVGTLAQVATAALSGAERASGNHLNDNFFYRLVKSCARFHDQFDENGTRVEYLLDFKGPSNLSLDFTKIDQLIANILSNSVRNTHQGNVRVHQRFCEDGNNHSLQVRISNIVTTQTDRSHSDLVFHGSGLGLAICQELAQSLGGDFHFNFERGCAESYFQLPIQISDRKIPSTILRLPVFVLANEPVGSKIKGVLGQITNVFNVSLPTLGTAFAGETYFANFIVEDNLFEALKNNWPHLARRAIVLSTDSSATLSSRAGFLSLANEPTETTLINALSAQNALLDLQPSFDVDEIFSNLKILKNNRILVLDDVNINALLLKEVLEQAGGEVTTVDTIQSAISMVESRDSFHVVILDWHIGSETSLPIVNRLNSLRTDIAIFIISADSEETVLRELDETQIQGVLERPVSNEQIVSAIAQSGIAEDAVFFGLSEFSGAQLFDLEIFETLREMGTSSVQIRKMITQLRSEFQSTLSNTLECETLTDLGSGIHSLKGLADASGMKAIATVIGSYGMNDPGNRPKITSRIMLCGVVRVLWSLTERHLAAYDVSLTGLHDSDKETKPDLNA